MKIIEEFKQFAIKGNVVDMAVGVIIGGAFGKIVTSLVNNVIMPLITLLTGKIDLTELAIVLKSDMVDGNQVDLLLEYGVFLQNVIDFFIIAACVFFMVKLISKLHRKKEEPADEPKTEPEPTKEELLLTEIRDILKNKENE